jgi:hypothetical protein
MNEYLDIRNYSARDSIKSVIVSTSFDFLENPVTIKILEDGLQFKRAGLDDVKTYCLNKHFNQFQTRLSLVDLEAGRYYLVHDESDTDTMTYRLD